VCVGGRGSERLSLSDTCAVTKPTSEYARVSGGVGGDFVPARPSSCTLTSIDQRRAREAYSERQVLERTHSGAEECGRVRGGEGVGTAKSVGHCAVARPTWEYARACGGVRGDFGPARPSSCTLTSIDQRRAREVYSERQVLKGTHSGAEGSGRVVLSLLSLPFKFCRTK
jgi:hypothetical protein